MIRRVLSKREYELPKTTIAKLLKIAEERHDIISLGPGEPDFATPGNILRFASRSLGRGFTHYSPPEGRAELREAIVKKLKRENGIEARPDHVIVTSGSTEAIMLALMCTVDPGEEVLVPDPGFLGYKPTVELLNGLPVSYELRHEEKFQVDVNRVSEAVERGKTKILIINTPSNPTGTVLRKKALEELADVAVENDLLVISDEAYEKFTYGAKHVSIGSLNGMEDRVLTLHSFSKTYAMPGFRVGYAAGPRAIIDAMKKVHVYTSICSPTISQLAALEALKGPQSSVARMLREYGRRRKMLMRRISGLGWPCVEPQGAFYAFPMISRHGMGSMEFTGWMIKNARVSAVPGLEFGRFGEGFVRLSYATAYEKIAEAMDRVETALKKLKAN